MYGTHQSNRVTGSGAPLARRRQTLLEVSSKRRRWESNPLGPGCSRLPGHLAPASSFSSNSPSRSRTWPTTFARSRASNTLTGCSTVSGNRTPSRSFEDCDAIQHTHTALMGPTTGFAPASSAASIRNAAKPEPSYSATSAKHERKDSNPVRQFWRLTALPGAHSFGGYPTGVEPVLPASQAGVRTAYTTDTISWAAVADGSTLSR